jgi:lipopolysaccharide export system protein LptA
MFRRIFRSTMVLAALIGAYEAYVTFAVPWMEPALAEKRFRGSTKDERDGAVKSVSKYQLLLGNYFAKNHWSQVRPPMVLGPTEQVLIVIDDYTRHAVGTSENDHSTQLDVKQFAMVMFPTPPHDGVVAPRDAIIVESQQGAHLLFDDFRPEVGKIGQILRGDFPGPITIRSDMHEPGPDDDLLVETSDLKMNTKLMYTASPVRFRMGQNVGGGRELEIRFLADEHVQPREAGLKIAGFETLEIRREVRMRMQFNTSSLIPGGDKPDAPNPSVHIDSAKRAPAAPKPPVDVTCSGPFTFDFVQYVARVYSDVQVRQLNPIGPCDQLTCNQLDIQFSPKVLPDAKPEPVVLDPGKRQQRDLSRLEASAIVALGHPAVVTSPARKAEARGDRIQVALREQRLRIDGGNDVMLTGGPNLLRAPVIDYQQPPRDAASQLGRFRAAGPGSLHFISEPTKPDQVFQAAWQKSVQLDRDEQGQPVIVMEGRSELAFAGAGSLIADQIQLYLRELDGTAPAGFSLGGGGGDKQKQSRLVPDRLIALGNVNIRSPQFTGRTLRLFANFRNDPGTAPANPDKAAPAATNRAPGSKGPQQSYVVDADQMQLDVFLRKDRTAVPSTLACDGNIVLREVPLVASKEQPLEIRGGQLFVEQLDTKTPHVTLKGASRDGAARISAVGESAAGNRPLALLSGRGVTLLTDVVEMDGRNNHMWSDGPGDATLQMTRDLQGNSTAAPTPVKIHWQGGLRFDGRTVTFDRNVVVTSADTTLHCDRMLAIMAAPIQFGQHADPTATKPSQIEFQGQVFIENLSRDTGGVTSHDRIQLGKLTVDQQTGAIRGEGPGVIRSTRFGAGLGPTAAPPGAPQPATASLAPGTSGNKLHFLRVDFHSGLDGNMYTHEMTFHDRVRTVYGPVDSWEQELDLARPDLLPPESMTLTCDQLRLNEDPAHAKANQKPDTPGGKQMGPMQMRATGDVRIQGQTEKQGDFSIQANTANYDQFKDTFVLDGDPRTPAKLWRRKPGDTDSAPLEATKIEYVRKTNQVRFGGIQSVEINGSAFEKAPRPATSPARQKGSPR